MFHSHESKCIVLNIFVHMIDCLFLGLRNHNQGCVMSPWLFNVYMDGVSRVVIARVLG